MPKSVEEKVDGILKGLSDLMGVDVKFAVDPNDQGRVQPAYDVNAILSKMVALFVFSGLSVPATFAPPYNRVHADIEWWKKQMQEMEAAAKVPDEQPAAEQPAAATQENAESGG